jgi:glycine betaine/proline transport system substrate-binding protein
LPVDRAQRARQQLGIPVASGADKTADVPLEPSKGTAIPSGQASAGDADAYSGIFPQWSGADYVNRQLMSAVKRYGSTFRAISDWILTAVLLPVERLLQAVHPAIFLAIVALLSWHATRKAVPTLLYVVCLYAIGAVGLWDKLIQTLSLVLISTLFSIVLGIPLGIFAARNRVLRRLMVPVLDVMQTLPSFVYLIPVLMLFGLGKVPALFATIIYAVPPLIRLTILGLRQVDPNITEAAQAFGVTRWQMLVKVSLPLARPSIMAGINQTTMMALAMVVVASMIGARGLGEDVLAGIQTLDVGRGLQAGIAIVILAIVIDRITQAYGRPRRARLQQHGAEERL